VSINVRIAASLAIVSNGLFFLGRVDRSFIVRYRLWSVGRQNPVDFDGHVWSRECGESSA